jgi:hypothetical protein
MADPPILVPPKMVKPEDLHHHALEQLPNLAYCINDNPRWGKEVAIRSWQICVLLLCLVFLCLCCEDGAFLVVAAWKRSSTAFSCVQSWFCKRDELLMLLYEVVCWFVCIFLVLIWKKLPVFVCRRSNHLRFPALLHHAWDDSADSISCHS